MELLASDDNPRKMEPYHNLVGMISLKKGDYAEAAKHFKQANLNDIYVKYHLAEALGELGDDASFALYKEVSEYNFNSVEFALVRKDAQKRSTLAAN